MSILIVTVDFPPHRDGVSTVAREVASYLSQNGENVLVIGPAAKGAREFDLKQSYTLFRTPFYNWGYFRLFPIFLLMPFLVQKYRVEKVVAMTIGYGGILSYFFSNFFNFSYITMAHGYEFLKFENNSLLKKLYLNTYRKSKKVFANSHFVKKRLADFGVPEEKIEVFYPSVEPAKFYPLDSLAPLRAKYDLEGKKVLLTVSRLIERKGHELVIKSLKSVIEKIPEVLYLIVGKGPLERKLKNLIEEFNLSGYVRFLGEVSDSELLHFYNLCDVFIMPSFEIPEKGDVEGFGIVYLEANACAKPVIGGCSGGVEEAIEDGVTGILVDPLNTEEISQSIVRLLTDSAYAKWLGENGRKRVEKEFNWKNSLKSLYQCLKGD